MQTKSLTWAASLGVAAALGLSAVACTPAAPGSTPPQEALYTPVGLALSANGERLYVVNANFNQRFRNGWISSLDVTRLLHLAQGQGDPEDVFAQRLLIPSLGGSMTLDASGQVGLVACRGSGTAVLLETTADGTLSCGDAGAPGAQEGLSSSEQETDCDRGHLLRIDAGELTEGLAADYVRDPFATLLFDYQPVAGDSRTIAAIGQLRSTWMGFYAVQGEPGARTLTFEHSVQLDRALLGGVGQIAARPGERGRYLAAVNRRYGATSVTGTLYMLDYDHIVADEPNGVRYRRLQPEFGTDQVGGLAFSADGERTYVSAQSPDGVVELDSQVRPALVTDDAGDTTLLEAPQYDLAGAVPLLGSPNGILYVERQTGTPIVVAAALRKDALYILRPDGATLELVGEVADVGQGPFAMVYLPFEGRDWLLVTTFYDHGVAVVDISGDEPRNFARRYHLRSKEKEYDAIDRPH